MQHGVIVFVLRAPEVLHAQTLGGNMLSRDSPAVRDDPRLTTQASDIRRARLKTTLPLCPPLLRNAHTYQVAMQPRHDGS